MQINIAARHGHLSDVTQEKIRAKVDKLVRLFERVTAITVTVDLANKESVGVEILVNAEHKHDFVASESGAELIGALDGAVHKVEQQIRKYKEKLQEHHRGPSPREKDGTSSSI